MVAKARKKRSLKERRRRTQIALAGAVLVSVLAVAILMITVLRSSEVTIAYVSVSPTEFVREELVERAARDLLAGSYFFVVPRANTFLFPGDVIKKELRSLFVSIEEVSLRREGFTGLTVMVDEYEPESLWCASEEVSATCYFMDETGLIFAQSSSEHADRTRFVGALSGEPLGERFLPGTYEKVRWFIAGLSELTGEEVAVVSVDEYGDALVVLTSGGELKFSLKDAGEPLLQNIESVFSSRRFDTEESLDYADFRFGNKVYVKFKGE